MLWWDAESQLPELAPVVFSKPAEDIDKRREDEAIAVYQ